MLPNMHFTVFATVGARLLMKAPWRQMAKIVTEKQTSAADEEPRDLPVRTVCGKGLNTETEPGFTTAARMRLDEDPHERQLEAMPRRAWASISSDKAVLMRGMSG